MHQAPGPGRRRLRRLPPARLRGARGRARSSRSSASAADGRSPWSNSTQLNPDLVILDVEMPEMDGLAALAEIRKRWPDAARHHVQRPHRRAAAEARSTRWPSGRPTTSPKPLERRTRARRIAAGPRRAAPARSRPLPRRGRASATDTARQRPPHGPGRCAAGASARRSTWSRSAPRPAGRTRWPSCSPALPADLPVPDRASCSTCRRCSPGCWPSG